MNSDKELNIIIVGPGIMPIPPKGWGACEILIWDISVQLKNLGHKVTILNTRNMSEVIDTIKNEKPDFVHIQYDDYAHIASEISQYSKIVAITSHYGYLDQPNRWGAYINIFNNIVCHKSPNIYHFALSESIKQQYLRNGVNPEKIFVTPNGADETLFRYTNNPQHKDRSIVLGQIQSRKGQYKLMNMSNVWFAGNWGDNTFDYNHPRLLGEWTKPMLYESLTDYGNLILLSDGEADPLVIKEAFVAGLGVVVSEWAAANLDRSKPFISVIPHDKFNDIEFISNKINENREISISMRSEIKEYSKNFMWSELVKKNVELIHSLIAKH